MKLLSFALLGSAAICLGLVAAGNYMLEVGINRKSVAKNNFIGDPEEEGKPGLEWLASHNAENLSLKSSDGLTLKAYFAENPQAGGRLAIIVHGYGWPSPTMYKYAELFFQNGYSVFMADNRANGLSEGKYVGMGYLDAQDLEAWLKLLAERLGEGAQFALFGISMGGAAVMMAAAKQLPAQVKCVIEDCGYSTAYHEFAHQMKTSFHLPAFPILQIADRLSKLRAGYRFSDADALSAVKQSKLPILFIHGDSDRFVPTQMGYDLYEAALCEKELVIFEGARHGESFATDPEKYKQVVLAFLSKYIA